MQKEKQEGDAEGARLSRDLTVAEETYTALAHKVEEEKITSQNTGSGVRMASKSAVPMNQVNPQTRLIVFIAIGVGLLLGLVIALASEWWRD